MDMTLQSRSQGDAVVEMVRREGKLSLTDSLVEQGKFPSDQIQRIKFLKPAEKTLREELQLQEEISQLVQSGKDNPYLLKNLKIENKSGAGELHIRERTKSLQGLMELWNNRILELIIENVLLVNTLSGHKVKIGTKVNEHQNIALQDKEIDFQAVLISEEHLRQELIRMSANLQEYVGVTQCLKMELIEEWSWKNEFETCLIIEALKGKVVDLIEEMNLIGDNLTGNQRGIITLENRMPRDSCKELISLHSSKAELEEKLRKNGGLTEDFKQMMEEKNNILHDELHMFTETENGISVKGKLPKKEFYVLNCKNDSEEGEFQERMKKQPKLEENAQMFREAKNGISFLEQEVGRKEGLLQKDKFKMQEQSWRFEFEEKLLSTCVEGSFPEFPKHIVETQGNLHDVGQRLLSGQNELVAAQEELRKWKAKVHTLKSDVGTSSSFVDQLQAEAESYVAEEVEGSLWKRREEALELMQKREDGDWRSHTQTDFLLGLVEGSTQEYALEFAGLGEGLKLMHHEVLSLSLEIEEQNSSFASYLSVVLDLRTVLVPRAHDLLAFRRGAELTSAMQRDALLQGQVTVIETMIEMEDLKKVQTILVARIEEENQRVQQLQEALAEQNWKNEVELEMIMTVVWEGKSDLSVIWNKGTVLLPGEAQIHHVLDGQQPRHEEASNHMSLEDGHDVLIVNSSPVHVQLAVTEGETPETTKMRTVHPDSFTLLERQTLRCKKDRVLEQKTDEIYKLEREYCKDVEKIKGVWRDDELVRLKWELPALRCEAATLEGGNEITNFVTKEQPNDQKRYSKMGVRWDSEKLSLIKSIFHREEQIKDVSKKLSYVLANERTHGLTWVSSVEYLAGVEKKRSRLNALHDREKEKQSTYYKKLLMGKDATLIRAIEETENKRLIGELEIEYSKTKDGIADLRIELGSVQKHFKSHLERIQALMVSSEHLENHVSHKLNQYNVRLDGAQDVVNYLLQRDSILLPNESEYLQNIQNLQKAETEVDMLGDEVDALMDIIEKVYNVLNHHFPILQHYPGLAELMKELKKEVLKHFCFSNEG